MKFVIYILLGIVLVSVISGKVHERSKGTEPECEQRHGLDLEKEYEKCPSECLEKKPSECYEMYVANGRKGHKHICCHYKKREENKIVISNIDGEVGALQYKTPSKRPGDHLIKRTPIDLGRSALTKVNCNKSKSHLEILISARKETCQSNCDAARCLQVFGTCCRYRLDERKCLRKGKRFFGKPCLDDVKSSK
jgi:hypothetical protein